MAKFDLEERTIRFAKDVRIVSKYLLNSPISKEDFRQLQTRFPHRLKIARKEAKESFFWLLLLIDLNPQHGEPLRKSLEESKS